MDSQSNTEVGFTRVILVRHGQSTFNAEGKYQGRSDESVLTAKGYQSAYQTGVALQKIAIDAIYTSPLQRAIATAHQIIDGIGISTKSLIPINTNPNLTEIDLSLWQGKTFEDVRQNFAADYQCWQQRPHKFQIINQDPLSTGYHRNTATAIKPCPVLNLYEQAKQFWQSVLPRHLGKTILVVSHGGTNRALISSALNLSPARYHTIQQSNCGVSILNFPANSLSAKLSALNLTSHLGELPKLKAGKHGLRLLLLPVDAIALSQLQQLAEFLKPISIDFSLTSELCTSQEMTAYLLQHHPTTVQLQVSRHNFPLAWQQTIDSRCSSVATNTLVTGLVIASSAIIKCIIGQILGLDASNFWRLQLKSGCLSVVHYPLKDSLPVSQAINLSISHTNIL